ncbi:phosphoenolpyruvate--protein phosphotransferase [Spirochaeta isovalerica]|uniref:Phosphoenolpyruvate-protein phosphotransferase n=1 Tax=Spirochaeta isovalerica TaxID=150 RepID=A0A841RBT3_9SPIO|nr:phosphoenolpyruvate--protein phosphotransferase [Spirochaeta isovalerica]MBB6480359.1 phosphotransferase system enzyme I (PtsI) [Spirochaeta isovalerica]
MNGLAVSGGISFGKAFLLDSGASVSCRGISVEQIDGEMKRFLEGRDRAAVNLEKLIEKVRTEMGDDKAEIFEGHLEILTSDDVEEGVREIIVEQKVCAEKAAEIFAEDNAREMEELDDEYFRERGQDFRDIGQQLIKGILNINPDERTLPDQAVVMGEELSPSQTASLDMSRVKGLIVKTGGKNSHAAIIARSLEIPALIMPELDFAEHVKNNDIVYVDGESGELWVNPDEKTIESLKRKEEKLEKEKEELLTLLDEPSATKDGHPVGLYANVGGTFDIGNAVRYKADGIGLFRTEFLFMETMSSPTLARQTEVYQHAVESLGGRNVIIRLLDTGADKPLPYWPLPREENPFLGIRGIRLLFQKEDILRTQIQALLQASKSGPVGMMIPMIGSLKPIERVRALVEEEKLALGWTEAENLMLGVMIETPAAVQLIKEILDIVDFVSIGTNDLTQYMLAADRGNPSMTDYYDEFHPAVLRSIAHVIKQAGKKAKLNGICGELAGNPLALPFFVGLGVDELSTNASSILKLKKILREIDFTEAENLVEEILRIPTSEGIRMRLHRFLAERDLLK